MHIKHRQTCRVCGNPNLALVIDLGEQFFQGSFLHDGVIAPPTRKTPNCVVRCDTSKFENACGLIQTKNTVPPEILYTNYWYESGISDTMRQHLKTIANAAVDTIKKKKGLVLDIASNDNTLLRAYPKGFKKVGVDPSNIAARQNDKDIWVINELFPTLKLSKYFRIFDVITSIACFYDIEDPKIFADQIRWHLRDDGIWIFEVAYWPSMLNNLAYDSIVNEHIIHYHLAPLEVLLDSVGLKIFNAGLTDTNGGSIICFVCKAGCHKYDLEVFKARLAKIRLDEFNQGLDEEITYQNFRAEVAYQRKKLRELIGKIKEKGETIHIYGASTKLNTILGYCGIGPDLIHYAAERSPSKVGGSTIGGIKLISEEDSRRMKPNYYLVGPYHFKKEILIREANMMKEGTKFIFPLPEVKIYPYE